MRILMIEDDRDVSKLVSHFIETSFNEETSVEVADNLRRGNECLQERVYDLILLDVMLPDGNGLFWLRNQAAIAHQQVPVIVLSSDTDAKCLFDSMQIGTARFLSKTLSNFAALPDLIDESIEARFARRDLTRTTDQTRVA